MTNQEKQNALLKDIKKVLNDHGAELFMQNSANEPYIFSKIGLNNSRCSIMIGQSIDGTPIKDIEWYKEREDILERELAEKDDEIDLLSDANLKLGRRVMNLEGLNIRT